MKRTRPRPAPRRPAKTVSPLRFRLGEAEPSAVADWFGALAIAVGAGLLLWLAFARHPVGDYFTESDFYGGYAEGARLVQRGVLDPSRYGVYGPGYEWLLALFGWLIPDLFDAAKALSVAASIVTLIGFFLVLRRRVDAVAGAWTVLFLAVNPVFLRYGFSATTDASAAALQAAALCAGFAWAAPAAPLVSGLLAGFATLTRYTAVAWAIGLALAYAWWEPLDAAARRRALAGFAIGFLLVVGPWTAFSIARGHVPGETLARTFTDFYANPDPSRNLQDRPVDESAPAPGVKGPGLPRSLVDHLRLDLLSSIGAPLAVVCAIGVAAVTRQRKWRALAPLWAAGLLHFLALAPVFYSDRYSLPHLPVLLAFAGAAVALLRIEWSLAGAHWPLGWALAAIPLALGARSAVPAIRDVLSQMPVEVREAGRVLRERGAPGSRVLSRKGHVAYYAGMTSVPFPRLRTVPELAAWCREQRADYLYFSWYEAELRPEFWALLDTTHQLPGLTVMHVTERNPSVLYRIGAGFGQVPAWFANDTTRNLQAASAQLRVLEPDRAWAAHMVLGVHAADSGRLDEAEAHFRAAAETPAGAEAGWLALGEVRLHQQRPAEAIEALTRVLAINNASVLARERLGMAQLLSGDVAAAALTWRPLVDRTTHPALLQSMLYVYERTQDAATAARIRQALGR